MAHLFVIAGHGAGDNGAPGGRYVEAERVRSLAKLIKKLGGDNVTLGDLNRDYYADNGISTLNIPSDWEILELHMDSSPNPSARGGHVVILAGNNPDSYDTALANFIASVLPGRSDIIVGRDNLANPYRAAERGYSYRLLECGFISNAGDLKYFNTHGNKIATGILNAFGINTVKGTKKNLIVNASVQPNTGDHYMRLEFKKVDGKDDVFEIKNKKTGYYMTASENKKGANVDFREFRCNGGYQEWKLITKTYLNATYKMFECVATPGLYLSVEGNGVGNKGNLKLYSDLHNLKQKFFIREESDGSSLIIHAFSFKCVSAR